MLVDTASRCLRRKMYDTQNPMTAAPMAAIKTFNPTSRRIASVAAKVPNLTREKRIHWREYTADSLGVYA